MAPGALPPPPMPPALAASVRRIDGAKLSETARHKLGLPKPPSKPRNAFHFYTGKTAEVMRAEHPGLGNKQVTAMVNASWKVGFHRMCTCVVLRHTITVDWNGRNGVVTSFHRIEQPLHAPLLALPPLCSFDLL